jgi:hypothetical protein
MNDDEMGGKFNMYGRCEKCIPDFVWETKRERSL